MAGWDPSFVDPTAAPVDARITQSLGGRTGPLTIENGSKVSFPWAAQQQQAGSFPGEIYLADASSGTTVDGTLTINGAMPASAATNRAQLKLGGIYYGGTIPLGSLRETTSATLTAAGSTVRLARESTGGSAGTASYRAAIRLTGMTRAEGPVEIYDGSGGWAPPFSIWKNGFEYNLGAGIDSWLTINHDTVFASDSLKLDAGGVVACQKELTIKTYSVAPLYGVENAAVGTAPSVTGGYSYRMIAGRQSVTFSSGAGTVTLAGGGFATGLLTFVATSEYNDFVVAHNKASSTKTAVAVTGFDAGVAAATSYTLDYIAIGW